MKFYLHNLDKRLKVFLIVYLSVITIGVTLGLFFVAKTTSLTPKGTVENFNGNESSNNEFEIAEKYPKPINELIISTHNHILGLAFIFFTAGLIFNFNSCVKGKLKTFIMIEPLISIVITFGSIWFIRFVDNNFVYLTFVSSILMYLGYYTMTAVSLYELVIVKTNNVEIH